jgi:hypothetical protein
MAKTLALSVLLVAGEAPWYFPISHQSRSSEFVKAECGWGGQLR